MLTPEQIAKMRQDAGLSANPASPKLTVGKFDYLKKEPTIGENIATSLKERGREVVSNIKEMAKGEINPVEFGVRTVGGSVGAGADVIGSIISPAVNSVLAPIFETDLGKKFAVAIKTGGDAYNQLKYSSPTATRVAKDIESIVNIASLIPATKIGQTGVKSVARAGESVGKVTKEIKPVIGEGLEKAGEYVYKSAIPLSANEAGAIQAFKALPKEKQLKLMEPLTAGKTAMEKGFVGTEAMIGVQAKREMNDLWESTVKPALSGIKEEVETSDVFNTISEQIKNKIKEPSRKNSLLEGLAAMEDDYKDIKTMTHSFAQDIKSDLYKFIPEKIWAGKNVASSMREVQAMFASELRRRTRKALSNSPEALKAFDDYGNLKALSEFGKKAMTGAKKKGGFGSFVTSLYENATIPVKTGGGIVLKKAGELLKK